METHVVTFKTNFPDGGFAVTEFFRGSKSECESILRKWAGARNRRRRQKKLKERMWMGEYPFRYGGGARLRFGVELRHDLRVRHARRVGQ